MPWALFSSRNTSNNKKNNKKNYKTNNNLIIGFCRNPIPESQFGALGSRNAMAVS